MAGFDASAGERLVAALNRAFPVAEVEPNEGHLRLVADMALPDDDDRHVLAAAVAAEATVLCTSNVRDFPANVVSIVGIEVLTPDQLLSRLASDYEPEMIAAHRHTVASLKTATDESTIAALRIAGAPGTAAIVAALLGGSEPDQP